MKPVPVVVVGCGHLGAIHARKLAACPDFKLADIVDPCESHRQRLAAETGATPHASLDEVRDVQAAVIAAPTTAHFPLAQRLLEQGIHLFVEKPLTPTSDEAHQLCRLAARRGCVLQVGHVERFNPALVAVEDRLSEPRYIEARRTSGFTFRSVDIGAVFDLMIHDIDLVLQLARSAVIDVQAFGWAMLGQREDTVQARLSFENGCIADLYASRVSQERCRRLQVMGATYTAQLDLAAGSATLVTAGDQLVDRAFDAERFSPEERTHLGPAHYESLFFTEEVTTVPVDAIEAEHANFLKSLRGEEATRVDGLAGLQAVEIGERILTAIEHHEWDGHALGRIGPLFEAPPRIIRPTEWQPAPAEQRKAG